MSETADRLYREARARLATRTAAQLNAGVANSFAAEAASTEQDGRPATSNEQQAAVSISSNSNSNEAAEALAVSCNSPLAPSEQPEESADVEVQDIVS